MGLHVPATVNDLFPELANMPTPSARLKMCFVQIPQLVGLAVHGDEAAVRHTELFVVLPVDDADHLDSRCLGLHFRYAEPWAVLRVIMLSGVLVVDAVACVAFHCPGSFFGVSPFALGMFPGGAGGICLSCLFPCLLF